MCGDGTNRYRSSVLLNFCKPSRCKMPVGFGIGLISKPSLCSVFCFPGVTSTILLNRLRSCSSFFVLSLTTERATPKTIYTATFRVAKPSQLSVMIASRRICESVLRLAISRKEFPFYIAERQFDFRSCVEQHFVPGIQQLYSSPQIIVDWQAVGIGAVALANSQLVKYVTQAFL